LKFVNRERELGVLEKALSSSRSELVLVYGRRRIGKTFLLKYFQKIYGGIYLVVNYSDRELLLRDLSRQLSTEYGFKVGVFESFRDLYSFIVRIADKNSSRKPIIIFDEAQRLAGSGGLSELQYLWDTSLCEQNILFILSGSGVGIITRSLLSYESPLYGRITKVLHLDQFKYREARVFMEKWSPLDKVRGYSVFGGTPAYLSMINDERDLSENIYDQILDPSSILHYDPLYMLSIETREPQRYLAILSAISHGKNRIGEIASYLGLPVNIISKYLYVLENALGIIKKVYPLGFEGKKRYGQYIIIDYYYRFWLNTIYPKLGVPDLHTREYLNKILKDVDKFASQVWEDIAKEHLQLLKREKKIHYTRIGKWWHKDVEIDLVALDDENKTAYFIECKFSKKPVGRKYLEKLREKSSKTPWKKWGKKYIVYTIIEPSMNLSSVEIYTLEDVERDFNKYKPAINEF